MRDPSHARSRDPMAASHIYKVVFVNQGKVYEIYARKTLPWFTKTTLKM